MLAGEAAEESGEFVCGAGEDGAVVLEDGHAGGVVEDKEVLDIAASEGADAEAIRGKEGTGDEESKEEDGEAAQEEEDEVFEADALAGLLEGLLEEVDGSPVDELLAAAVEEVDEDGDADEGEAPEEAGMDDLEEGKGHRRPPVW